MWRLFARFLGKKASHLVTSYIFMHRSHLNREQSYVCFRGRIPLTRPSYFNRSQTDGSDLNRVNVTRSLSWRSVQWRVRSAKIESDPYLLRIPIEEPAGVFESLPQNHPFHRLERVHGSCRIDVSYCLSPDLSRGGARRELVAHCRRLCRKIAEKRYHF
jgi:hypothetical protein